MPETSSVLHVFLPLNARLYDYEVIKMLDPKPPAEYKNLMDNIGRALGVFDPEDIWNVASDYQERITGLLILFTPQKGAEEFFKNLKSKQPAEEIEETVEFIKELSYYFNSLEGIMEVYTPMVKIKRLKQKQATLKPAKTEATILLPESFTVKQLSERFNGILSLKQAALFLFYLKENSIMPNYNNSQLGELAKVFFSRNDKNIRESLTDIQDLRQGKKDLQALKDALISLTEAIDVDLKKAY